MRYGRMVLGALALAMGCETGDPQAQSAEGEVQEVAMDCNERAVDSSFADVRKTVYEPGESFLGVSNQVYEWNEVPKRGSPLGALVDVAGGGLSEDLSQILQCRRDYRSNPENVDKIIHAPGICASATWTIDDTSEGLNVNTNAVAPYTGLFAPGTRVNAIVRISSGTNQSNPNAWVLGASWSIGIKLFPVPSDQPNTPTKTVQLVMFDQNGVAGTFSQEALFSDSASRPHFFANWLYGNDAFAVSSVAIFNKFVVPHEHLGTPLAKQARLQAIDEVARVAVGGAEVPIEQAHYPTILKLSLDPATPRVRDLVEDFSYVASDFRKQLLVYYDGEIVFDIIADKNAKGPDAMRTVGRDQKIGQLVLDAMVVSDVCDRHLTFKHRRHGQVFTGWRP